MQYKTEYELNKKRILNQADAAEYVGCSAKTIRQLPRRQDGYYDKEVLRPLHEKYYKRRLRSADIRGGFLFRTIKEASEKTGLESTEIKNWLKKGRVSRKNGYLDIRDLLKCKEEDNLSKSGGNPDSSPKPGP